MMMSLLKSHWPDMKHVCTVHAKIVVLQQYKFRTKYEKLKQRTHPGQRANESKSTQRRGIRKNRKVKKVFGLFSVTDTLENIVQTFINSIPKLKLHIYTAHRQWNAHATSQEKLTSDSVITIEDYQQNIEVHWVHWETYLNGLF